MRSRWQFPSLSWAEWLTFSALSAALSLASVYTTLFTGWGDGGAIIAVLATVLVLRSLLRRTVSPTALNLGQTMASAGGYMGFAVAWYASVAMADPSYEPPLWGLLLLFIAAGVLGTLLAMAVRPWMVRYCFPSGTACAVIQRAVTSAVEREGGNRSLRIMVWSGVVAAIVTLPTKIALRASESALLPPLPLGFKGLSLPLDPLLYGIGAVVGLRTGVGLLIGGVLGHFFVPELLGTLQVDESFTSQWTTWLAISFLVLPTAFSLIGARWFGDKPVMPVGFEPGVTQFAPMRKSVYALFGVPSLIAVVLAAHVLFDLPGWLSCLVLVASVPISLMNGRISGDTDVNPVTQMGAAMVAAFLLLVETAGGGTVALLGVALIASTVMTISVDAMYDFRTGYLLDRNPHEQSWVQFIGVLIGALTAVPFVLFLQRTYGFGPGGFAAPGAQIYTTMAMDLSQRGSALSSQLITVVAVVSAAGSAYAFLSAWPKAGKWMPSLFGVGIGLLLGFAIPAAIFAGSVLRTIAVTGYARARAGAARAAAVERAEGDILLAGSSVFAVGALVSVAVILLLQLLAALGSDAIRLAG